MTKRITADEVQVGDHIYPSPTHPPHEVVQVRRDGLGDVHIVYAVGGLMEKMPPLRSHAPVEVEL